MSAVSGPIEYFYKGVSGCVYRCIGDCEFSSAAGVHTCAISKNIVPFADFEYIEDVYESILRCRDQGTFIYEKYEDLPQWRIDVIRGQILRFIQKNGLLNDTAHPGSRFMQEKFPQYWKEARVLDQNGLLTGGF